MKKFLKLHRYGRPVLVSTGQIQTIWPGSDDNNEGSTIYFAGEPDGLSMDESFEYIKALIMIADHG